ncbi:hypothetical protein [Amphritea japonica]|uniref:Peptidase M16 C-terminal domain-containing protein n=1 Tax=Amphritea japonica ATCC BAA-1530 TaxID=1278309 RepID=A0A7R6P0T8_9GAMM|nr:hypothetical protein [Amphritea japonica]BBB24739.1 conserved hypothetical protein [Amphritea japonica ATCC BAA-1530]
MAESKSPLFNRTYLKIIIWVIAIAIVLLTAGQNRSPDYLTIDRYENSPLYSTQQNDATYLQIGLLFRTGAAISNEEQLLQTLLLQTIQQRLNNFAEQPLFTRLEAHLKAEATPDRIKISLAIPAKYNAQPQDILKVTRSLLQQLQEFAPPETLEQRWNRLEAELYLSQKDPENQLLNQFFNQIAGPTSVHPIQRFSGFYRNSISPTTLTLTLQGPELETLPQLLSSLLPGYQSGSNLLTTAISPEFQQLKPTGKQSYLLTGQALPGRQQENFALELLAVRTLQQLLNQPGVPESRLLWKSLDKQGYLAIILHGSKISADSRITPIMQSVLGQLDDRLIDATRTQLQDNYKQQMEQTDAQLGLLDTIAFYQLPVDYLASFEKQLTRTDNQHVRELITQLLTGPNQYQLLLPAY